MPHLTYYGKDPAAQRALRGYWSLINVDRDTRRPKLPRHFLLKPFLPGLHLATSLLESMLDPESQLGHSLHGLRQDGIGCCCLRISKFIQLFCMHVSIEPALQLFKPTLHIILVRLGIFIYSEEAPRVTKDSLSVPISVLWVSLTGI